MRDRENGRVYILKVEDNEELTRTIDSECPTPNIIIPSALLHSAP